jgi:DNA invertase Pin-like site-specific DNA recombinase
LFCSNAPSYAIGALTGQVNGACLMPAASSAGSDVLPRPLRAAQYLRMSTDPQKYSIENQAAAIAAYAARRSLRIVRTCVDRGRSGLQIAGRDGLQELINDVQLAHADFDCILVYDISRWGRFQDVDESAYYEFICRRAGVNVHYCADEFENDGSLSSIVLKNIKRVAAADYSRQLSKKVFVGHSHIASLGYWRGGPAGYGLRRLLVDEHGKSKAVLEYGQRKNLKTERVVLVPGPKSEVKVIRRIFTSFAVQKKSRTEIAAELNAERIRNARGKPWSMLTIGNILKNEAYLGHIVFNRKSAKLGQRTVRNPAEMWIRRDNAFKPIIKPELFAKAQQVLAELDHGRTRSDQELIDRLRALWRREGRLSVQLMMAAKDVPDWTVYAKRFGSLTNAYRRIGYKPKARCCFRENADKTDDVICSVANAIISDLEKRGKSVTFLHEIYLLMISQDLTLAIAIARAVSDGTNAGRRVRRWELGKVRYKRSDLILVVRMNECNTNIQDYFWSRPRVSR